MLECVPRIGFACVIERLIESLVGTISEKAVYLCVGVSDVHITVGAYTFEEHV